MVCCGNLIVAAVQINSHMMTTEAVNCAQIKLWGKKNNWVCVCLQVLMEDRRTNRLVESMNIFETIVNNKLFLNVSIILFLNKTDLLVEKIHTVDIRKNFPEFRGDPRRLEDVQVHRHTQYNCVLLEEVSSSVCEPFMFNAPTHKRVLNQRLSGCQAPTFSHDILCPRPYTLHQLQRKGSKRAEN